MKPMMKCGHAANATRNGAPCCAICIGLRPGADEVDLAPVEAGRMARCPYCKKERPSSSDLPFFARNYMTRGMSDATVDTFYCGCRGWE